MKKIQAPFKLDNKLKVLKKLEKGTGVEDNLFDGYNPNAYTQVKTKKAPLEQKIALGITTTEKDELLRTIKEINRLGTKTSISAYVRNLAVSEIDLGEWEERAREGLKDLSSIKWDKRALIGKRNRVERILDGIGYEDDKSEDRFAYEKELAKYNKMLQELEKPREKKGYKLSGRVTTNEANYIRWRAARLTLSVADYVRFLVFNLEPFSEADQHLSVIARKRFYVSIFDVLENGWGEPPLVEDCSNCARYKEEVAKLKIENSKLKAKIVALSLNSN